MTNSKKMDLIQQYAEPNHQRIASLAADGHDWTEAEEVDRLERREAVLLELGARGKLNEKERDELDNIQRRLHALVGSENERFVGTSFAGDGLPSRSEVDVQAEASESLAQQMLCEIAEIVSSDRGRVVKLAQISMTLSAAEDRGLV
jgi:hypothetical protein